MWFLEKVRASPGEAAALGPSFLAVPLSQPLPDKGKAGMPAAAFANVLTPDKIPEFCIPPRLAAPPPAKSPSPTFQPHRCFTEPHLQGAAASAGGEHGPGPYLLPHLIQVESVEEIPAQEEDATDSDPRSQAALSLPHFPKAQTSYGFCALLESPHTRRKESIFHSEALPVGVASGPGLALPRPRASSYGGRESASSSPISIHSGLRRPRFLSRQAALDSDTASSNESSPFSSPRLGRSPPKCGLLFKTRSQEGLLGRALRARSKSGKGRANSLSTDEASSTDSSPNATRRSSESLFEPLTSRAYSLSPLPIFPLDLPCGRERFGRESTVPMDKGGLLRLCSEYCAENRHLRVRLISAEGLYGAGAEAKHINCCISFSLVPGKIQKQRSTVIKRSRNPIFNEDFFFVGLAEEDLYHFAVRMKAVNKGCGMKKDLVLGESEVPLMSILAG